MFDPRMTRGFKDFTGDSAVSQQMMTIQGDLTFGSLTATETVA